MNDEAGGSETIEARIASIYNGPLDGFISRRDAAVKALRAAGRREDAAVVKTLRKPSRLAWALDAASFEQPDGIRNVAAAVAAMVVAQSGGGDLRSALHSVRTAVQGLADAAAGAAAKAGISLDDGELVNAVMAVIGSSDALALLRAGRLVDVPEAGGLDFFAGPLTATTGSSPSPPADSGVGPDDGWRDELRRAERALATAREHATTAERVLRDAEAVADRAEQNLRLAQQEALARRSERDRAREAAEAASARLLEAERAMAHAERNQSGS